MAEDGSQRKPTKIILIVVAVLILALAGTAIVVVQSRIRRFPDGSNTGVPSGTTLQPSGPVRITTAGQIIDGLEIRGDVLIQAPNVTIRNSRIVGGQINFGYNGNAERFSLTIEDCELDGSSLPVSESAPMSALGVSNLTARRMNIHGYGKGVQIEGDNVTLEDSWLHGITYAGATHNEPIYAGGGRNIIIRHNTIDATGDYNHITGAVVLLGDFAAFEDVTVRDNILTGGGYTVYAGSADGKPFPLARNTEFVDNVFTRDAFPDGGRWGPVVAFVAGNGNVWADNTWQDTGLPVEPH